MPVNMVLCRSIHHVSPGQGTSGAMVMANYGEAAPPNMRIASRMRTLLGQSRRTCTSTTFAEIDHALTRSIWNRSRWPKIFVEELAGRSQKPIALKAMSTRLKIPTTTRTVTAIAEPVEQFKARSAVSSAVNVSPNLKLSRPFLTEHRTGTQIMRAGARTVEQRTQRQLAKLNHALGVKSC